MLLLFLSSLIPFIMLQIKVFFICQKMFPLYNTKQKAYFLSTFNSLVLSLLGIYFNIQFFYNNVSVVFLYCLQLISIIFFTSYLCSDILVGLYFYKQHINFTTGYFHHFIYICINIYAVLSNNTFFYTLYFISEIPTFILSLGSVNPKFRMNKLFGFTFFITRILYHSFVISLYFLPSNFFPMTDMFNVESRKSVTIISTSILGLHCHWFIKWYAKYT